MNTTAKQQAIEDIDTDEIQPDESAQTIADTVSYTDGGGTVHWFAIVPRTETPDAGAPAETSATVSDPFELRYFRQLDRDDGIQLADSCAVMPLASHDRDDAWQMRTLELCLQHGNVYMAQEFAHELAQDYDYDFPHPFRLPALNPTPEYHFELAEGHYDHTLLYLDKTWMDGVDREYSVLELGVYEDRDEAYDQLDSLDDLLRSGDLEGAMNLAEQMALEHGTLDPERSDPRLFTQGPPDPFRTLHQAELQQPSYSIGATSADGQSFVDVVKSWGQDETERLLIPQPDWPDAATRGLQAVDLLERGQVEQAMQQVERWGVDAGVIDPDRDDPRLFQQGPPDQFVTLREAELNRELSEHAITWRQMQDWPPPTQPDPAELQEHYHRLDVREVETPDGRPLGYTVMMTAYPELPADFDPDQPLTDDVFPIEAWAMNLAHFSREQQAAAFADASRDRSLAELAKAAIDDWWQTWDRGDIEHMAMGTPHLFAEHNWHPRPEAEPGLAGSDAPRYWHLDALPVDDTQGERLGHAVVAMVYHELGSDPFRPDEPAAEDATPVQMLELVHVESYQQAEAFRDHFHSFIQPGIMEGKALAEEVARLEGFSDEWQPLKDEQLQQYLDLDLRLTRERHEWRAWNPDAERERRFEAEGPSNDPILVQIGDEFDL